MSEQKQPQHSAIESAEKDLVLSLLERDQLAEQKKRPVPRRQLNRGEIFVLSVLRLYLLFMIAVVIYEVWTSAH